MKHEIPTLQQLTPKSASKWFSIGGCDSSLVFTHVTPTTLGSTLGDVTSAWMLRLKHSFLLILYHISVPPRFIYLFNEYSSSVPCVRFCTQHLEYTSKQNRKSPLPVRGLYSSGEKERQTVNIKDTFDGREPRCASGRTGPELWERKGK